LLRLYKSVHGTFVVIFVDANHVKPAWGILGMDFFEQWKFSVAISTPGCVKNKETDSWKAFDFFGNSVVCGIAAARQAEG
jgi:hypothetical protein